MRRYVNRIDALILCSTIPFTHAQTSYRRELRRLRQRIEETRHLMELGFGRIEACLNNIRAQLQQQPQSSHESNMPPEESGDDRFKVAIIYLMCQIVILCMYMIAGV